MKKTRLFWVVLALVTASGLSWALRVLPANSHRRGPRSSALAEQAAVFQPRLPVTFEPNAGQSDPEVDFISHNPGYTAFIAPDGLTFTVQPKVRARKPITSPPIEGPPVQPAPMAALRLRLVGANSQAAKRGRDPLPGKANYLLGNDPSKWKTGLTSYSKVEYAEVYPGVDLVYYGQQTHLEYDFVVHPYADPKVIALGLEGAQSVLYGARGELNVRLKNGSLVDLQKPVVYQERNGERRLIAADYLLDKDRIGFKLGEYDHNKTLVIDPELVYSAPFGGGGDAAGWAIALDRAGNIYVAGDTNSPDLPTAKALQDKSAGSTDIFVAKFSPNGLKLLYSTYIGGSDSEVGCGIAVDRDGYIYVTGDTSSKDFPLVHPVQNSLNVPPDVFVLKLDPSGSKLVYSTYIGGSAGERAVGIAVDSGGNAYVAGHTVSRDFPTLRPFQPKYAGGPADAFVLKLTSGGDLAYSTYLGGGNDRPDMATAIAVDQTGSAYVTGYTNSADFPTVNPIQKFAGPTDVFVTKLNPTGSELVYSTFIGGNADDEGMGIAVDDHGSAYVTGETESLNYPVTAGALSTSCVPVPTRAAMREICLGGDGFITKLSPDGSRIMYSTYLNGSKFEAGRAIAVDPTGAAYVAGITGSADFPLVNPIQKVYGGGKFDAFVLKLNPEGSALLFSTFLGGSGNDGGFGIAIDAKGNASVTGYTESPDFPTAPQGPRSRASGEVRHAFVVKIDLNGTSQSRVRAPAIQELPGRVVASGIPGIAGIAPVGQFHAGGPIRDKPAFRAFTEPGSILDPQRILVTSTSNFGAPLAEGGRPSGSVISIDPRGSDPIVVPSEFASADGQTSAVGGRVKLFTANSPAFLNSFYNPKAGTAHYAPVAAPTGIALNNAFGRIWVTSMPLGPAGPGIHSILDPDGRPLDGAPNRDSGGVFTANLSGRKPQQVLPGMMMAGAIATVFLGKSPDGGGRAVFASLHADGSLLQLHTEYGIDGLAPPGTITPFGTSNSSDIRRAGMVFNWVPDAIVYITDPMANSIVALSLVSDGKVFRVAGERRLSPAMLREPTDIAPAIAEAASPTFSSNTTLAGGADFYVVNRGNGTIVRLRQDGSVVACRKVVVAGTKALGAGRLNGIAVSPDARHIWVTITGKFPGYSEGAVVELPVFGAS